MELSHPEYKNFIRHDLFLGFLLARGFECRVAYDIGAYEGEWTRWLKRRWPAAQVYMFEPLEEMWGPLEKVAVELAPATLVRKALGRGEATRPLSVWSKISRASFIEKPGGDWGERTERSVAITSVDVLAAREGLPAPDIIKLDIQGFELEALAGAAGVLPKVQIVIMEVSLYPLYGPENPVASDVIQFMKEQGFVLFDIIGFYRRPVDHALEQADFVFVRENHPLLTPGSLSRQHDFDW